MTLTGTPTLNASADALKLRRRCWTSSEIYPYARRGSDSAREGDMVSMKGGPCKDWTMHNDSPFENRFELVAELVSKFQNSNLNRISRKISRDFFSGPREK